MKKIEAKEQISWNCIWLSRFENFTWFTKYWNLFCCLISFFLYVNSINADFVYDDRRAILSNSDVNSSTPLSKIWQNDYWGTEIGSSNSHGSYRPLCVLTFRLNHLIFGYKAWSYHVVNVMLYCVATWMTYSLGTNYLLLPETSVRIATLLFAVHPIHTEAVSGIVGRADILSCIFYLLTIRSYIRYSRTIDNFKLIGNIQKYGVLKKYNDLLWTIIYAMLGTISKEIALMSLAVCVTYEMIRLFHDNEDKICNKWRKRNIKMLTATIILILIIRFKIMGTHMPNFSTADNPTARNTKQLTRILTFLYLPVLNFQLFIFPSILSYDWSMESITKIETIYDFRNIYSIGFYIFVSYFISKGMLHLYQNFGAKISTNRNAAKCEYEKNVILLAMLILPFIPSSNLFFYVGFVIAERVLFIPSVAYCYLIGHGYHILKRKYYNNRLLLIHFWFLIIIFAIRTVIRNEDWKNEEQLYKSGIQVNPSKSLANLGCIYSDQGRLTEAENAYRSALELRYNMADVHYNLGLLLERTGRLDQAIERYRLAIHFRKTLAVAYLKLSQGLLSLNKTIEAEEILLSCTRLDTKGLKDPKSHEAAKMDAFLQLAQLYSKTDRRKEALSIYEHAFNNTSHKGKQQSSLFKSQIKTS